MAQPGRARILIVDDEAAVLEGLERYLRAQFDLTAVTDPKQALELVRLPIPPLPHKDLQALAW